ncbi:MAG TPA: M28 family peptidase [Terriglobales bacterium]
MRLRARLGRMWRDGKPLSKQFLGQLARALIICIVGVACGVCVSAQTSAQAPKRIRFRLLERGVVEGRLKSFSDNNGQRGALIRKWFVESGCKDSNLSEQALGRKLPPNVICVLPGETSEVIVVGAHTDKVESYGDGVVDNWTGAVLLPALLYSLSAEPRHHTLIFIGFSAEEKGLVGSQFYVDHLTGEQRTQIEAMVNFDSLGLGPTEVWSSHADRVLLNALAAVAFASKLPVTAMNVDNVGTADSESFARYQIPRITLHSVTQETWSILHSPFDKLAAIKMNDYYDSYKLIAEYLAYLDGTLKPEPGNAVR